MGWQQSCRHPGHFLRADMRHYGAGETTHQQATHQSINQSTSQSTNSRFQQTASIAASKQSIPGSSSNHVCEQVRRQSQVLIVSILASFLLPAPVLLRLLASGREVPFLQSYFAYFVRWHVDVSAALASLVSCTLPAA